MKKISIFVFIKLTIKIIKKMNELQKFAKEISNKYPQLLDKINELLHVCYAEIEYGAAEMYEVEECYESIKELVSTVK